MTPGLTVDDRQLQAALSRLLKFGRGAAHDFLAETGAHMRSTVQLRFDRQQGPAGVRWWPSARAAKEGGQTLRLTSRLRNSISYRATAREMEVGTNVEYAPRHNFGFKGVVQVPEHRRLVTQVFGRRLPFPVWGTVRAHSAFAFTPARPFLGFDAQDQGDILDIAREHLDRLIGRPA